MIDKNTPEAIDLEETVLGSLMMDGDAYDKAVEFLKEGVFYKPNHQIVFKAIKGLYDKNLPIDIKTVAHELKNTGYLDLIGGPTAIVNLTAGIGSTANIQYHCAILFEKHLRRELIRIGQEMEQSGYGEEDIHDAIGKFQDMVDSLTHFKTSDYTPAGRMAAARTAIYKAMESATGLSGVSTGWDSLDKFTGGLQGGDLIVAAGWPGTFKSAITLALQHNAEKTGTPTFMFEQEMSDRQVGIREIAMHTGIGIERLKTGDITKEQAAEMEGAIGRISNKKVFVDLSAGLTSSEIRGKLRKAKKEHDIGLGVIDYLELCDLNIKKWGSQENAISNFCREMKITAKQLDIPIILLAQFTKQTGDADMLKLPHMGLLKGSGGISANADTVWLLWNPSATDANHQYDYMDGNGPFSTHGKLGIYHAKNRQGRTGLQWLNVNPATHIFSDITN